MFCSKCGKAVEDRDVFCASCGARVAQIQAPEVRKENPPKITGKKSKKFLVMGGLLGLGVAAVAAAAIIMIQPAFLNKQRTSAQTPPDTDNYAEVMKPVDQSLDNANTSDLQLEADYIAAKALLESGGYAAASHAFAALGDYKDAAEIVHNIAYLGTYRNSRGEGIKITITEDGQLRYADNHITFGQKQEDGSFLACEISAGSNGNPANMYIYPVGVSLGNSYEYGEPDDSMPRLYINYPDAPDISSNVYYKVEPLPSDAISYLPKPNTFYEFSAAGITAANWEKWTASFTSELEETEGGEIRETLISAIQDGQPIDLTYFRRDYIYYEDATGLYSCRINVNPFESGGLRIKYPLRVGTEFQSADFYGKGVIESVNETVSTDAGVFENVVVVSYEFGEGGYGEKQYFAPGAGLIKYEAVRSNGTIVKISDTLPLPTLSAGQANEEKDYILPYSSTRKLTVADLQGLGEDELRLARNEIYARYGRLFNDQTLQAYFNAKAWYAGTEKLPLGTDPILTELERENIDLITEFEVRLK